MRILPKKHIGSDGTLLLEVPTDLREIDVDVTLDVQPRPFLSPRQNGVPETLEELGWPPGFFEATAGQWQGEPLERGSQVDFVERTYGCLSDDPIERLPRCGYKHKPL